MTDCPEGFCTRNGVLRAPCLPSVGPDGESDPDPFGPDDGLGADPDPGPGLDNPPPPCCGGGDNGDPPDDDDNPPPDPTCTFTITGPKFIGVLGAAAFSIAPDPGAAAITAIEWTITSGGFLLSPEGSDSFPGGVNTNPSITLAATVVPGVVTITAKVTINGETCTRTHTLTIVLVDLVAFRPQTPVFDFEEFAIPDEAEEDTGDPEFSFVGAGIRLNGDDDNQNGIFDSDENPGVADDDLVAIDVVVQPGGLPTGATLFLVRSSAIIRVLDQAGSYALSPKSDEVRITPGQSPMRFWVTNTERGKVDLRLELREEDSGAVVAHDTVTFQTFRTLVVALTGEELFDVLGADPFASGVTTIARELYAPGDGRFGYDVRLYDEDDVSSNGFGQAFDDAADAINMTGAMDVAIFGHSHGGGSTHDLAALLQDLLGAGQGGGLWTLRFTAYIDAIQNNSDIDVDSETRLPPGSGFHLNMWEGIDALFPGAPTTGPAPPVVNIAVNAFPWGVGLDHGGIDDDPTVQSNVIGWLRQNLQAP